MLPTIIEVDHVSLDASQWALTLTLVVGAVTSPVLGRLGDGARRKQVIVAQIAAVVLGCILSAIPAGFGLLLAGRALQGLGFALIPLAIAVARDSLPTDRVRPTVALLGVATVVGIGAGYPLVGVVVEHLGLHAAFWLGAAISAAALAAAAVVLPPGPDRAHRPLDLVGATLLGLGVAGLLLACAEGEPWGWASARTLTAGAVALAVLVGWVRWELRVPLPLVDLRLLKLRPVLAANVIVLLVGLGSYPLLSLVVRYVQTAPGAGYGFGASVVIAGTMLVPFSAGSYLASRLIMPLRRRLSMEHIVALNCGVLIASMVLFLFAHHTYWELVIVMTLSGIGVGAIFAVNPAQIISGVPPGETASANGFYQVVRMSSFSAGSTLSATILVLRTPSGSQIPAESGYALAAVVSIAILVVALGLAIWFARPAPRT